LQVSIRRGEGEIGGYENKEDRKRLGRKKVIEVLKGRGGDCQKVCLGGLRSNQNRGVETKQRGGPISSSPTGRVTCSIMDQKKEE